MSVSVLSIGAILFLGVLVVGGILGIAAVVVLANRSKRDD